MDKIVFFDGACGLCQRSVRWVHRLDRGDRIKFAPLQGKTAKNYLDEEELLSFDSVVFFDGKSKLKKTAAIFALLRETPSGVWKIILPLDLLPRGFLDFFYDLIARNRHHFYQSKSCDISSSKIPKAKILD